MLVEGCKVLLNIEGILRSGASVVSTLFRNVFQYITQKVYERVVGRNPSALEHASDDHVSCICI